MRERKPNPVSGSFALWDLRRCYQSRLQDQETAICARLRNYGEGEGFDEREINCPLNAADETLEASATTVPISPISRARLAASRCCSLCDVPYPR